LEASRLVSPIWRGRAIATFDYGMDQWNGGEEAGNGMGRARDSQFVPFISSGSVGLEAAGSTIDGPNAMQDHEVSGLGHRETPMSQHAGL
jgi:hypothetical protein